MEKESIRKKLSTAKELIEKSKKDAKAPKGYMMAVDILLTIVDVVTSFSRDSTAAVLPFVRICLWQHQR